MYHWTDEQENELQKIIVHLKRLADIDIPDLFSQVPKNSQLAPYAGQLTREIFTAAERLKEISATENERRETEKLIEAENRAKARYFKNRDSGVPAEIV
jgi:hypothetical protein